MPWNHANEKSALVQVMAWCLMATSHYLSQWLLAFNSSPSNAACVCQWPGAVLVQVMACCLFGAKPLPEPMLAYCQLDSWEQIAVKIEWEFYHFHSRKFIRNCRLPKWRPFCPGGDELIQYPFHSVWNKITLVMALVEGVIYNKCWR